MSLFILLQNRISLKVSLLFNKVSVVGDISVDTWVSRESAALSPRSGTNDVIDSVDHESNWSTGITLASILASVWPFTGAEHTGKDGTVVSFSGVASGDIDDAGVDAVELVGVVGLWVSDVAPAADSDAPSVLEPFRSGLGGNWEWDNVGSWLHGRSPADDGDVVGDKEWSVVRVSEELVQLLSLLSGLADSLVVGAGESGDGGGIVSAVGSADTVAHGDEGGAAEVRAESLHGENVGLGVGLDLVATNDHGGSGAGGGENGRENLKKNFILTY